MVDHLQEDVEVLSAVLRWGGTVEEEEYSAWRDLFGLPAKSWAAAVSVEGEGTALEDAWAKWVDGLARWDLFVTVTGVPPTQEEQATAYNKRGRSWVLSRFVKGLRWLVQPGGKARYFVALEKHQSGAYHAHGLVDLEGLPYEDDEVARMLQAWYTNNAGWSVVRDYEEGGGAAAYVAKYVLKEEKEAGELDWVYGEEVSENDGARAERQQDGAEAGGRRAPVRGASIGGSAGRRDKDLRVQQSGD